MVRIYETHSTPIENTDLKKKKKNNTDLELWKKKIGLKTGEPFTFR